VRKLGEICGRSSGSVPTYCRLRHTCMIGQLDYLLLGNGVVAPHSQLLLCLRVTHANQDASSACYCFSGPRVDICVDFIHLCAVPNHWHPHEAFAGLATALDVKYNVGVRSTFPQAFLQHFTSSFGQDRPWRRPRRTQGMDPATGATREW